jgi:hypothetical protein
MAEDAHEEPAPTGPLVSREGGERWKALLPWALPAVVAIAAHAPALGNGYVLDDGDLLTENQNVKSPSGLFDVLTGGLFAGSESQKNVPYFRPISGLAYWSSYRLMGSHAPGQHGLNVILHAALAVLLARVIVAMGAPLHGALALATLFAAHPATADIVAYVGGRQEMLGWAFVLPAMAAAATATTKRAGRAAFVACLLAPLSREFFLLAPIFLVTAALCRSTPGEVLRRVASRSALALAIVVLLRFLSNVPAFGPPSSSDRPFAIVLGMFARLAHDVLWPSGLAVDVTVGTLFPPGEIATGAVFAMASVAVVALSFRDGIARSLSLTGAAIWIALIVAHARVALQTHGVISDRYAYGAVLASAFLAAAALRLLPARTSSPARVPLAIVAVALACIVPTWSRVRAWKDEATLLQAMVNARPGDPLSDLTAGVLRMQKGDIDGAYPLCKAYRDAVPTSQRADFCVALWHFRHDRPAEAAAAVKAFAYGNPGLSSPRALLFTSLLQARDREGTEEALRHFERFVPDAPDVRAARRNLATWPAP